MIRNKIFCAVISLLLSTLSYASNNCCNGHGAVAGCDDATGQLLCMDGTDSTACTCPTKDTTKSYDSSLCTPAYVSLLLSQEIKNSKFPVDINAYTASVTPLLMCEKSQTDILNPYGTINYLDVAYVLFATLSYNKFVAGSLLYHQKGNSNDLITAISWYKLCADDNVKDCQLALANIYALGSDNANINLTRMEGYNSQLNKLLPNPKMVKQYLTLAEANKTSTNTIYQFIIKTNQMNVANYVSQMINQRPAINYQMST